MSTWMERLRELRLPRPERAAARMERRVEAQIRSERDNPERAERRAAAVEAEARQYASRPVSGYFQHGGSGKF